MKVDVLHHVDQNEFSMSGAYSEPCETSKMDRFEKNSLLFLAFRCFFKALHLRCLTGF